MFKLTLGLVIGVLLVGCSAGIRQAGTRAGPNENELPLLIVQVCLRTDFTRKTIGFQTVKRASVGGGGLSVIGTTQAGQPVFENFTAPLSELQAVLVRLEDRSHFYFKPPTDATLVAWSVWRIPTALARDGNWGVGTGMVNGIRPELGPVVDSNAPMMRYRLMSFTDYLKGVRRRADLGSEKDLPPC